MVLSHGTSKCLAEMLAGTASSCPVENTGCIYPAFGTPEFTAQTAQVSFCPENKTGHSWTPSCRQLSQPAQWRSQGMNASPWLCPWAIDVLSVCHNFHFYLGSTAQLSPEKRHFLSVKLSGLFPTNVIESSPLSCS